MTTLAPPRDPDKSPEVDKTEQPSYAIAPGYRHFWLRRLHSLLGLVFGGYVTVHLIVNATGWWPKAYQQNVDKIHSLQPMLPLIELVAIFFPLLFHMIYGAYIAKAGVKFNTTRYNYGGNVRYFLQRASAWVLLAFLVYHVGTLHHWGFAMFGWNDGHALFNPKNMAYQTTAAAIKTPYGDNHALNLAVSMFYLLGVWAAVFHWANGLWTSAIAWGLTVTAAAQRRWGHVCLGFGVMMLVVGTLAWAAFAIRGNPTLDESETRTLPAAVSEEVHDQATGGKRATGSKEVPAGANPVTSAPAGTQAH